MPTFAVEVSTPSSKREKLLREAKTQQELIDSLIKQRYTIISISEIAEQAKTERKSFFQTLKKVFGKKNYTKDLSIATRQLATLLGAGISIITSFKIILESSPKKYPLRESFQAILDGLNEGDSLTSVMAKYPEIFSTYYRGLVDLGMNTGKLQETMNALAGDLEKDLNIRNRIVATTTYPMFTFIIAAVLNTVLFIGVLPKIVSVISDLNVPLPLITRFLMLLTDYVCKPGFVTVTLAILLFVFYQAALYLKTPLGKHHYDVISLYMPIIGKVKRTIYAERFCRSLGVLIKYGVHVQEAINITGQICNNSYMDQKLIQPLSDGIEEGRYFADILADMRILPSIVTQMAIAGEATGDIGSTLIETSNIFESDIDAELQRLLTLLEPAMIIMMSVMVLSIILAIMLPITQVIRTIGQ